MSHIQHCQACTICAYLYTISETSLIADYSHRIWCTNKILWSFEMDNKNYDFIWSSITIKWSFNKIQSIIKLRRLISDPFFMISAFISQERSKKKKKKLANQVTNYTFWYSTKIDKASIRTTETCLQQIRQTNRTYLLLKMIISIFVVILSWFHTFITIFEVSQFHHSMLSLWPLQYSWSLMTLKVIIEIYETK